LAAYNRVTRRFQNGPDLDAGDLNATIDDMKAWVLEQLAGFTPGPGGGPSVPAAAVLFNGDPLTFNGDYVTFGA
jgi:hypothetical protein